MSRGKIIVIEGSDGSGKNTQTLASLKLARENNYKVEMLSFPDYSSRFGKIIMDYKEGKYGDPVKINPYDISAIYALDRFEKVPHIEELINNKTNLIIDRYTESNLAHQGCKLNGDERKKFIDWNLTLENEVLGIPKSDLVLYLDVPPEHSEQLMIKRNKDGHEKDIPYRLKVYSMYKELSKNKNWITVECVNKDGILLSPEDITKIIWNKIEPILAK